MNDDDVLRLIDDIARVARERGASRIEVEAGDVSVSVTVDAAPVAAPREPAAAAAEPAADRTKRVHATGVGIFSAAREWTAGDRVERGAVLGAIQSLGHMTEVTAPADGRLREVLVAGGAPVEYGQALFVIDAR